MIGTQFWYQQGGVYVLWYLPLLLLVVFRPVMTNHFAPELTRLHPFLEDRLIELSSDEIRVTFLGRIFIRNLAMIFDPYLEKQHLAEQPLFSKTL